MKLLSVVIPLYREVEVCSVTAREDLWEHSKDQKHRVVLCALHC